MVEDDPTAPRGWGRRELLTGGLAAGLGAVLLGCGRSGPTPAGPPPVGPGPDAVFAGRLASLEARFRGRIGVAALDSATGARVGHRADERFLMLSTVKVPLVAAILRRSESDPGLLDRRVHWTRAELQAYAPATTPALATGLTVAELCAAALTVSDNTAANLLTAQLGGPPATTAFLRGVDDTISRADRTEPTLNDVAGDLDTSTPRAFTATLQTLTLGAALPPPLRDRLVGWMRATTTGGAQIRAGVPVGATAADKTGSGSADEANDVAVVWPFGRAPVVLGVFTAPIDPGNAGGKALIAEVTREVLRVFSL